MKLTKKILLGLGAVSLFALTGCTSSESSTDVSSLTTTVAYDWLRLDTTDTVSSVYTNAVYDPTTEEDFSDTSYYKIYAPTDIEASVRVTLSEIDSSNFGDDVVCNVKYLQTVAFSSTYQGYFEEKVSDYAETLNAIDSTVVGFSANTQTTWEKSLSDYEITSDSLTADANNFLAVYYVPLYVQIYSSSEVSTAAFFCVPVYTEIVTATFGTNDDGESRVESCSSSLVMTYANNDKYITYTYDSSSDIIS